MATPKSVSKMRTASRVCKLSAWGIAAIGLVSAVLYVSILVPVIPFFRQSQYLSIYSYTTMSVILTALFVITVPTIFFTIILYVLGTIIDYLVSQTKLEETKKFFVEEDMDGIDMEEDDGRLEIVPIPEMSS